MKSMKMDTDADFSAVMLGIVQDILDLSSSLHWPAASMLLIRLVSAVNSEMGFHSQGR